MKEYIGCAIKFTVWMLAAMMTFTGCSKKNADLEIPDSKTMRFAVSLLSDEDFTGDVENFCMQGGRLYFMTTDILFKDGADSAADSEETVSRGERTIVQHLYSIGMDGTDRREIRLDMEEGQYLEGYDIAPDGSLFCLAVSNDGDGGFRRVVISRRSADGGEQERKDISEILKLKPDEDGMVNGIKIDLQGNILVLAADTVYFLDGRFELAGKVRAQAGHLGAVARTRDGKILCGEEVVRDETNTVQAHLLDPETKEWGESYPLKIAFLDGSQILMDGCGSYDFYYKNDDGIYGYRHEGNKEDKLMDFVFSNVYGRDQNSLVPDGKGGYIGASYDGTGDDRFHLTQYAKAESSKATVRKMLTFATTWAGDAVEQAVMKFNRENTDYQIILKDYSGEEHPAEKLNMDIAAGNIPDIIQIPEGMETRYAADGLLEDLMPCLESDPELGKEDFIPSVLEAMQTEGNLYSVASAFELYSVAARTSDVGEKAGWTFEEFYAFLDKKGEEVQLFESESKMDMLDTLLAVGLTDFIDWESGTCSFDGHDFMEILKTCDRFGNDREQEEDISVYKRMHEGKVLFRDGLVDVNEFMTSPVIFGEPVTYIGYPNEERQGTYFQFGSRMGIWSGSEWKDGAWQFLRMFLTKELFEGQDSELLTENPVRQDCFDLMLEAQMAEAPYTNELGMEVTPRKGTLDYEGFPIKQAPMTREQAEAYRELVNRTRKSSAYDGVLLQIVEDEAKMYFAGEKSLEKTVEIIQERAKTYVNENR